MLEYRDFTFEDVEEAVNGRVYSSDNTVVIPHIGYPNSRLHSHDFYEIELFLSGGGEYTINGEHKRFEKGSLMYLAPSAYHSFMFDKAPRYEILSIRLNYVHTDMCEELFGDATGFCVTLPERAVKCIVADAEEIYEQKKHIPQPYMEQYVCGTLKRMLSVAEACRTESPDVGRIRDMRMVEVMMYIRRNFRNKLLLPDVAARFGYSANHMSRKIRETTGNSFSDYLISLRLAYAHNFVAETEKAFKQISVDAGFRSYACFSRAFVKKYGVSPSEVREQRNN